MKRLILITIFTALVFGGVVELTETDLAKIKEDWQRVDVSKDTTTYTNAKGDTLKVYVTYEVKEVEFTKLDDGTINKDIKYNEIRTLTQDEYNKLWGYVKPKVTARWKEDNTGKVIDGVKPTITLEKDEK